MKPPEHVAETITFFFAEDGAVSLKRAVELNDLLISLATDIECIQNKIKDYEKLRGSLTSTQKWLQKVTDGNSSNINSQTTLGKKEE